MKPPGKYRQQKRREAITRRLPRLGPFFGHSDGERPVPGCVSWDNMEPESVLGPSLPEDQEGVPGTADAPPRSPLRSRPLTGSTSAGRPDRSLRFPHLFAGDDAANFGGVTGATIIDNTHVVVLRGAGRDTVPAPEMAAFGERLGFQFVVHAIGNANRSGRVISSAPQLHQPTRLPAWMMAL